MIRTLAALIASLCLLVARPIPALADQPAMTLDLDKGSGMVTFDAVGKPSALKIHGKGDAPHGQLKVEGGKVTGALTFQLESLDTGIKLRNEHMKKRYLETEKFPEAKLTLTELALPPNYSASDFSVGKLPFKARLALHGAEMPVEGTAKIERKGDDLAINAKFWLKTEDFLIKTPSFAGITMANDVGVEVEIKAPFRSP